MLQATSLGAVQIVKNCNDSGAGSLRAAVASASDKDVVDLSQLPTQAMPCSTITLTSGEIAVSQPNLTLQGPAAGASVAVSGTADCATAPYCRVLNAVGTGQLSIKHLTISNGTYAANQKKARGGCIRANGSVFLAHTLVTNCYVAMNGVNTSASGGGIYASDGVVLLFSTVSSNTATVIGTGNHASGGGIDTGSMTSKYSTLAYNSATNGNNGNFSRGGGISAYQTVVLGSTLSYNQADIGGGADIYVGPNSNATFANSTISGNSSMNCGGLAFKGMGSISLTNSTVTLNHATSSAGGVCSASAAKTFRSSIIANNMADDTPSWADLYTTALPTLDNNIIMASNQALGGTGTITSDPKLGPLQLNGGPTKSHALLPSSPAIGQGNNSSGWSFDQRGPSYPRTTTINGVTTTDIGAFQFDTIFAEGF